MNKSICNFLLFIILLVLAVLFFGCEKPKPETMEEWIARLKDGTPRMPCVVTDFRYTRDHKVWALEYTDRRGREYEIRVREDDNYFKVYHEGDTITDERLTKYFIK